MIPPHICSMCIKTNEVGKQEVGIWWVQKRFPQYGIPIWSLWPNTRFLPSIVAEKNILGWTEGRTEVKQYTPSPVEQGYNKPLIAKIFKQQLTLFYNLTYLSTAIKLDAHLAIIVRERFCLTPYMQVNLFFIYHGVGNLNTFCLDEWWLVCATPIYFIADFLQC